MTNIAQDYLTASKHHSQRLEVQPSHTIGAIDGKLQTDKGPKTDFVCGLGANLIGWENCYSLPTPYEEELASRLLELFPFEKVKILKTGTDACNAAVRIARAYSGYQHGVGTGYHGWGNSFIAVESPGRGCVAECYSRSENFEELIKEIADTDGLGYCIIEPFELDYSEETIEQLKTIRRLCSDKKIVLIFDEIITGLRVPNFAVCNYIGVKPDLLCLGKALGNGHPVSVVLGDTDIMERDYFVSGTFFGETRSLRAALKTLDYVTAARLESLWHRGASFQRSLNILSPHVQLRGLPTRAVWEGRDVYKFWQQMSLAGYHLGKAWFMNFNHSSQVLIQFLDLAKKIIPIIDKARFVGPEPTPIFNRHG